MTAMNSDVGRFRFGAASGRWWWSDHVFLLHGMQPGDVVPTRELLLTHVQRDDRAVVVDTLDRCLTDPRPCACTYGLVDMSGATHRVVLAIAGDGDDELTGFLVDVTAALDVLLAERVNTELTRALESHAAIDQAKGVLMLTYGVDEDAAFEHPQAELAAAQHPAARAGRPGRAARGRRAGRDVRASCSTRPSAGRPPSSRRRPGDATSTCTPTAVRRRAGRARLGVGRPVQPGRAGRRDHVGDARGRGSGPPHRGPAAGWAASVRPSSTCSRRPAPQRRARHHADDRRRCLRRRAHRRPRTGRRSRRGS